MLSPELKAQASIAWSNWKFKLNGQYPPISEEEFVGLVSSLQSRHYSGLISRAEFDQKLNDILRDPYLAIAILKEQPPQRSTDSLLRELEHLHKTKILTDDEFEERKSELMYQRSISDPNADMALAGLGTEEKRQRLAAALESLYAERMITPAEYETIKTRL